MKKNILIYSFFASVLLVGCKKNDGWVSKEIALERVPAPLIVKDATGSASIDMTNLASFNGKVNISLYFPNDIPPSKFDIVIRKNNNNANIKMVQAGVSAFPATVTITAAQIAGLFGTPIVLGDSYDIGADVYSQSGKKYEAFPIVGLGYAAAFQPDHPGFSPSVRYTAICQYNDAVYQGNFVVVEDEFQDTAPGDVIVLTRIDATHFSYVYPSAVNPIPVVVTVNPLTNATSIAKQKIGSAFVYGFTNPNAATVASQNNVVLPCDQSFSVLINYTVDQGNFGNFLFKLKKQ